jgi:hypothetical protein
LYLPKKRPSGSNPRTQARAEILKLDECQNFFSFECLMISFWSARDGGGYYVMSSLGGALQKMASTAGTHSWFHSPADWSADGTELVYAQYRTSGSRMDAFAGFVSSVTREMRQAPLPGMQESRLDLSWSRDGRYIAYIDAAQQPSETTQLRVVRLSDGTSATLTSGRSNAHSPRWSIDGRSLYYVFNQAGTTDLWRQSIGADGRPSGDPNV